MRVIIAGSRDVEDYALILEAVKASGFSSEITEVISGTARGADSLGELWAIRNKIPVKRMSANWSQYGKRAGILRNEEMAKYASEEGDGGLIAIWDGKSRGTKSMIDLGESYGLRVFIHYAHYVEPDDLTEAFDL